MGTTKRKDEMTIKDRPAIVITMGDAAGIGPEIVVKALLSKQIYDICCPLVVGDGMTMSKVTCHRG